MNKFILALILAISKLVVSAQDQHLIDSLQEQLNRLSATKKELGRFSPKPDDTTIANLLYELSRAYLNSNPVQSTYYAEQCMNFSEQIGYKKGIGNALNTSAANDRTKGDLNEALNKHFKALKIREEIKDQIGMAGSNNNIGLIYWDLGNYPEALRYLFRALAINRKIGNKSWEARNLNNIASIYSEQHNPTEALKMHFTALKISKEINDSYNLQVVYAKLGFTYIELLNYTEALKYLYASLRIAEKISDKVNMANAHDLIGWVHQKLNNYNEALKHHFKELELSQMNGNVDGMTYAYLNIGEVYLRLHEYEAAEKYVTTGLSYAKKAKKPASLKDTYKLLSELDSIRGNYKSSLENYKLYLLYRDSLVNTENVKKTVAMQLTYDFEKKQDSLNALQAKKDLITQNERNKQRLLRNGFIAGFVLMVLFTGIFLRQRNHIAKGKQKSDDLLLNILPSEVADELKETGSSKARLFQEVTVMFTDFKDFTSLGEKMSPEELVNEIDACFSAFDTIIERHGIEKIKTIGDAYMCAGGIPVANQTHAEDVVRAALEIRNFMNGHKQEKLNKGDAPFEIRIGIHSGPVVAGIVGLRKFAYDIWGDTVNLANRVESHGEPGKVNISGSTYELIKDKFTCSPRGKIMTKGKGEVDMYFVEERA